MQIVPGRHSASSPPKLYVTCPKFFRFSLATSPTFTILNSLPSITSLHPGEIFIYLGIAQGVQKAGFDMTELGLRYMLVGLVMNFFSGWVTDFTTKMVMKQQGIELSNELK